MAEKFWTHLKLKNGDTVKFVPPAPNGTQLGGITEEERAKIGSALADIDKSLTLENYAADAKAAGDGIRANAAEIVQIKDNISALNEIGYYKEISVSSFDCTANELYKCCQIDLTKGTWMIHLGAEFAHSSGEAKMQIGVAYESQTTFPAEKSRYSTMTEKAGTSAMNLTTVIKTGYSTERYCMFFKASTNGRLYPVVKAVKISK